MKQNARAVARSAADAADLRVPPERREVSSAELFGGARVVLIRHADAVYSLRQTSSGKLILTK